MIKKSDIVREAVQKQDWKKALQIAKDFHIGITQEQRSKMARAYECIVYPDFYRQIGVEIPNVIEQGKAVVKEYAENTRRTSSMMKWEVKHDRAKRIIDTFLDSTGGWQDREDLSAGLTDEDKALVNAEMALMIASIRKRYKLQERLPEQTAQIQPEEIKAEKAKETVLALESEIEQPEQTKRPRKVSTVERKATTRRKKKEETV